MLMGLAVSAYVALFSVSQFHDLIATMDSLGSSTEQAGNVAILSVQRVGVFESTTIKGSDPLALERWLKENRYELPASAQPAIERYCQEGWVFVASKVWRTNSTGINALHPLAFTFPVVTPVYPMALTAASTTEPCRVDLYVAGQKRASARGFRVERCDKLVSAYKDEPPQPQGSRLSLGKEALVFPGSKVATKLTATLTPRQMRSDVKIHWRPYWKTGALAFSNYGALIVTLNMALPLALLGWFLIGASRSEQFFTSKNAWQWRGRFIVGMAIFGVLLYLWLPKVPVEIVSQMIE